MEYLQILLLSLSLVMSAEIVLWRELCTIRVKGIPGLSGPTLQISIVEIRC